MHVDMSFNLASLTIFFIKVTKKNTYNRIWNGPTGDGLRVVDFFLYVPTVNFDHSSGRRNQVLKDGSFCMLVMQGQGRRTSLFHFNVLEFYCKFNYLYCILCVTTNSYFVVQPSSTEEKTKFLDSWKTWPRFVPLELHMANSKISLIMGT